MASGGGGRSAGAADVEAFWRDGVVLLRRALGAGAVERLAAALDRTLAEQVPALPLPRTRGGVAGHDQWLLDPDFRLLVMGPTLPELAAKLLKSRKVNLYDDAALVQEPGRSVPFRHDGGALHLAGKQILSLWCPLDAVPATTAPAWVRSSHRWSDDAPAPSDATWDLARFDLEPGDVVAYHARTLHGGGSVAGRGRRRVIVVRYCGDDARFLRRPGSPLKPWQAHATDGEVLDRPECPVVWRAPGA